MILMISSCSCLQNPVISIGINTISHKSKIFPQISHLDQLSLLNSLSWPTESCLVWKQLQCVLCFIHSNSIDNITILQNFNFKLSMSQFRGQFYNCTALVWEFVVVCCFLKLKCFQQNHFPYQFFSLHSNIFDITFSHFLLKK